MRICFLAAGEFTHVGLYLDYFREAGHDVHFVALSPSPPRSVPVHDAGFGGAPNAEKGKGKWRYAVSMLRAPGLVRRLRPDLVHAHFATSGGLAGLLCGVRPTVVTAHGTDLTAGMRSPLRRALLKAVFARAACVNTVSADLTRMALSLGVARSRIAELTPGVDTARFRADGRRPRRADEPLRLVCTRRLEPVYGHRTIVEALALARGLGVEFRITFAGDGPLRGELSALLERRGLGGVATFAGTVGADAMPALLGAHHVYLSASTSDGTSLSLLEAMSAGLLPVVSRIPANEAWLEHGEGGLLHAPNDPAELAACVAEAAGCPALIEAAAVRNRAVVVERGDRAKNMRRLERIYEELISAS